MFNKLNLIQYFLCLNNCFNLFLIIFSLLFFPWNFYSASHCRVYGCARLNYFNPCIEVTSILPPLLRFWLGKSDDFCLCIQENFTLPLIVAFTVASLLIDFRLYSYFFFYKWSFVCSVLLRRWVVRSVFLFRSTFLELRVLETCLCWSCTI